MVITKGLLLVSTPALGMRGEEERPSQLGFSHGHTGRGRKRGGMVHTTPCIRPGLSPEGVFGKEAQFPLLAAFFMSAMLKQGPDVYRCATPRQDPDFRLVSSLV